MAHHLGNFQMTIKNTETSSSFKKSNASENSNGSSNKQASFSKQLSGIEQQKLKRVVDLIADQIGHPDHVIAHIVSIFSGSYSQEYGVTLDLDGMTHSILSLGELLYNIIVQLYDSYIETNLKVSHLDTCYNHLKLLIDQEVFRKENQIYLTTMLALKKAHLPALRLLSQQLGHLKSHPAREYQHLGVFDLEKEFPY